MKISKRAQGMSSTNMRSNINDLKTLLEGLTVQNLPAQLGAINKLVEGLEVQVASMEAAQQNIKEQVQNADDARDFKKWLKDMSGGAMAKIEEWLGTDSAGDDEPDSNSAAGVRGCDDSYSNRLNKAHEEACKDGVPAFWRRNLDYGSSK